MTKLWIATKLRKKNFSYEFENNIMPIHPIPFIQGVNKLRMA